MISREIAKWVKSSCLTMCSVLIKFKLWFLTMNYYQEFKFVPLAYFNRLHNELYNND